MRKAVEGRRAVRLKAMRDQAIKRWVWGLQDQFGESERLRALTGLEASMGGYVDILDLWEYYLALSVISFRRPVVLGEPCNNKIAGYEDAVYDICNIAYAIQGAIELVRPENSVAYDRVYTYAEVLEEVVL